VGLAGLGIHEVGLDRAAVSSEERVRQRTIAPVDTGSVKVDEERRHRVQEPVAVAVGGHRDTHEEAPVLERVAEVFRDKDGGVLARTLRDPDRADGRQRQRFEANEHLVLVASVVDRLFLQRIGGLVDDDKPDEMARRAHRQVAQDRLVSAPVLQRQLPRQRQERIRGDPKPQVRNSLAVRRAQRRFRR